jgi:hypothetical protein
MPGKKVPEHFLVCIVLRKIFWNSVPAHSVTKIPLVITQKTNINVKMKLLMCLTTTPEYSRCGLTCMGTIEDWQ